MALPLIGFGALLLLATILFLIGVSRHNVNASLGFIALAGTLLIVSSMFVMNEGLQLGAAESFTESGDTTLITYQTVDYDINSYNWLRVVTDTIFWGGFVAIIIGFAYNFNRNKSRQVNEWAV